MDDQIRISDADRDRVTARLRDHYAEGRLTLAELDERITATLTAKTFGDLRPIMADLPGPGAVPPRAQLGVRPATAPLIVRHRGPRLLPLLMVVSLAALLIPGGGWLFFAFLKAFLVFWLVACVAGVLIASRIRRRVRRTWQPDERRAGQPGQAGWPGHPGWPGGHYHDRHQHSHW
jgi:hypothetical protein